MPEGQRGGWGALASAWHVLIGPPLRARDITAEQITPVEGLSALSLDALTSVAYGPEAIIAVLALPGAGALHLVLPITVAIVVLLAILVFSYRQVIDAYPGVGGADAGGRDQELRERWARWDPGVPLQVLRTAYASVAGPIVEFVDTLRRHERIVVLIPVILPSRLRYRFLHNHLDLVLTRALRSRPDVIVARVNLPLHIHGHTAQVGVPVAGSQPPGVAGRRD